MRIIRSIQNRIYEVRGERLMLDSDLATLYGTSTKMLNWAIRRNIKRFPKDFMFQLTDEEFEILKFQIEVSETNTSFRLQNETTKGRGGRRYLSLCFYRAGSCHVKWDIKF